MQVDKRTNQCGLTESSYVRTFFVLSLKYSLYIMKELHVDRMKLHDLIRETVTLVCKKLLPSEIDFGLDALICVTPDDASAILLNFRERVVHAHAAPDDKDHDCGNVGATDSDDTKNDELAQDWSHWTIVNVQQDRREFRDEAHADDNGHADADSNGVGGNGERPPDAAARNMKGDDGGYSDVIGNYDYGDGDAKNDELAKDWEIVKQELRESRDRRDEGIITDTVA